MGAFSQLPFQFQQRGRELAAAVATGAKNPGDNTLAQFHEQRDQDLENYLGTLKGARVSEAAFTIPTTTVVAGSGPQVLPLTFVTGTNGLLHADTDGFVPLDTAATAVICISGIEVQWAHVVGTTTAGMAQVFASVGAAIVSDFVIPTIPGPTLGFTQSGAQIDQIPTNTPLSALSAVVQLTDTIPDITTSGGPMGGISSLTVTGAAFIYIVD